MAFQPKWCRVELAGNKRQLLSQQNDERTKLLAELDKLNADYSKEFEDIRRHAREKKFIHEISRAHRYAENKDIWEYLNNIVEDIHLYTWRKCASGICTRKFQRNRQILEEDLRDLDAHHRKQRIRLRYESPSEVKQQPTPIKPPSPRFFMS
ncbi:hypothetical protein [Nitrospira sp. M1]